MDKLPNKAELADARGLTKKLFAHAVSASESHIQKKLDDGLIPARKDGKRVAIDMTPNEYIDALPAFEPHAGTRRPGPGRPRKHEERQTA